MKRIFLALMMLFIMVSCACADVEISAANFPDNNFRACIRRICDYDNDGILTDDDLAFPGFLDVSSQDISSLKGIEFFTGLNGLHCANNNLTGTLDLSRNTALTWLNCENNNLTGTLDLSNSTALTWLSCKNNQLTSLNITGCMNLEQLHCQQNLLRGTLDLKDRKALTQLWCPDNYLEQVILNGCNSLIVAHFNLNNITSFDLSGCISLEELYCDDCELEQLDVTSLTSLKALYCYNNHIKNLNLSRNTNLEGFNCSYNKIEVLDVSANTRLIYLDCGNNYLHAISLQNNTALQYLYTDGNYLTEIDLSGNTALKEIDCHVNKIQHLDLTRNTNLEIIALHRNSLTALNLAGHTALKTDDSKIKGQTVRELNISFDADNIEYPYSLNLNNYMASSQISGVIASSVKGLNDEDEEISSSYANGIIRFSEYPAKVKYNYGTGLGSLSMDVMITSGDTYTGMTALNNHVYRIFTDRMTWQEAKEYCESLGGHLVTLTSKEEHDVIEQMLAEAFFSIRGSNPNSTFWTGGQRKNGVLSWVTGEEFNDTFSTSRDGNVRITYVGNYYIPPDDSDKRILCFICEWDSVSFDSAPMSEQFILWSADPEAYYDGLEFYGAIPEPTDLSHLADNPPVMNSMIHASAVLPSQYDLRDYGHITSIKNQNPYGTCWAFAAVGAIESNYLVQNPGVNAPDLSELHLAWYVFRDSRQGYSFPLNDTSESILNQGGWPSMPIALFSRFAGPALESELPYSYAGRLSSVTAGRTPESYTRPIRVKEAYTIGNITASNRELVKNLVINHGAVMICYSHSGNAIRGSSYYSTDRRTNHAVEIIGWDDDYSRSNFNNQPSSNGAWLVRNSWGTSWGDSGYFWMSYEQYIGSATVFIAGDMIEDLKHYGHDELGSVTAIPNQWSANIFRAADNEDLIEIGFYTRDNNVPYEIYINRLGSELPVNPGAVSSPVLSGTMTNAGYHTVTLTNPVELEKGRYFSVILKTGKSSSYSYVSAVESHYRSGSVMVNEGESYFASSNSPVSSDWTDGKRISGGPYNACVKVFTVPSGTDIVSPAITTSSLPDGKRGEAYSYTLTASGAKPITWSASGLPEGLSLSDSTITGTPLNAGNYTIYVTARNAAGSDSRTLSLRITSSSTGGSGGGGGCDSFTGIYALLALSVCAFMKKR